VPRPLTLPNQSKLLICICIILQIWELYVIKNRPHGTWWLLLIAFFAGGLLTDLISGIFHFTFDYVWPPNTPIMGPIAVEFHEHHLTPTLDPSALTANLTKGVYGAIPLTVITLCVAGMTPDTAAWFAVIATLGFTNLWMLGFHQIHAYAHMGSELSADEFNRAVREISRLPEKEQRKEFARLFQALGIPPWVRLLQRSRLFLRPEVHWQHHITFESDFSSVNGWSDPMMNWLYRLLIKRMTAKPVSAAAGRSLAGETREGELRVEERQP